MDIAHCTFQRPICRTLNHSHSIFCIFRQWWACDPKINLGQLHELLIPVSLDEAERPSPMKMWLKSINLMQILWIFYENTAGQARKLRWYLNCLLWQIHRIRRECVCVDIIPRILMANIKLFNVLLHIPFSSHIALPQLHQMKILSFLWIDKVTASFLQWYHNFLWPTPIH